MLSIDLNKDLTRFPQMNEVAALTHASLLKQASGVAVDGALQLLHRTLRATLDFSSQYRSGPDQKICRMTSLVCSFDLDDVAI